MDVARLAGMTKQGAGKAIAHLEARGYVRVHSYKQDDFYAPRN